MTQCWQNEHISLQCGGQVHDHRGYDQTTTYKLQTSPSHRPHRPDNRRTSTHAARGGVSELYKSTADWLSLTSWINVMSTLSVSHLPTPLSITQPINHTAYQPHSWSVTQPINHTAYQSHSLSITQPINHTAYQSHSLSITQPINHIAYQSHSSSAIQHHMQMASDCFRFMPKSPVSARHEVWTEKRKQNTCTVIPSLSWFPVYLTRQRL